MCRVNGSSDKKVYIRRFLKQKSAYLRSTVVLDTPFFVFLVVSEVIPRIFKNFVDSYNTLRYQVNALYLCDGRYIGLDKIKACNKRLMQIFRRDCRGRSSAYNVLSLF